MGGGDGVRRAEAAKLMLATTSFHYATYESGDQPARSQHFTFNASRNAVATTHQHATAKLPPGGMLPLPSTPLPLSTHPSPPVFTYVPARSPLRFTPPPPPPPQPRFTCTTNEAQPRQPEQAHAYVASSIQKLTPRSTSVEPQPRPSSSQDSQQLHSKRKRCEQSTSHNNVTAT